VTADRPPSSAHQADEEFELIEDEVKALLSLSQYSVLRGVLSDDGPREKDEGEKDEGEGEGEGEGARGACCHFAPALSVPAGTLQANENAVREK
jgi:hypothetical protein